MPASCNPKPINILDIDYDNAAFMLYEQGRMDWHVELTMDYTPSWSQASGRAGATTFTRFPRSGPIT